MFMIRDKGHREHFSGQADLYDKPRARVVSWRPCDLLCCAVSADPELSCRPSKRALNPAHLWASKQHDKRGRRSFLNLSAEDQENYEENTKVNHAIPKARRTVFTEASFLGFRATGMKGNCLVEAVLDHANMRVGCRNESK